MKHPQSLPAEMAEHVVAAVARGLRLARPDIRGRTDVHRPDYLAWQHAVISVADQLAIALDWRHPHDFDTFVELCGLTSPRAPAKVKP